MPHFSADDHDAEDPELLARLRAMLRGPDAPRRPPTLAERFGARAAAEARGDDRREAAPAGHAPRRRTG